MMLFFLLLLGFLFSIRCFGSAKGNMVGSPALYKSSFGWSSGFAFKANKQRFLPAPTPALSTMSKIPSTVPKKQMGGVLVGQFAMAATGGHRGDMLGSTALV